jgi:hypothetical protein
MLAFLSLPISIIFVLDFVLAGILTVGSLVRLPTPHNCMSYVVMALCYPAFL